MDRPALVLAIVATLDDGGLPCVFCLSPIRRLLMRAR